MEDGQKMNISLESPLDIKSSDMLVPVSSPQFQHNRQRYQGHCLPNSVRFEHDGWAAGNEVYEFDFYEGSVSLGNSWTATKNRVLKEPPVYKITVHDEKGNSVGTMFYNMDSMVVSTDFDEAELDSKNSMSPDIKCRVNGYDFVIKFPDTVVNNDIEISGNPANIKLLDNHVLSSGYIFTVRVQDTDETIHFTMEAADLPTAILNKDGVGDEAIEYTLGNFVAMDEDGVCEWRSGNFIIKLYTKNTKDNFVIQQYDKSSDSFVNICEPLTVTLSDDSGYIDASVNIPLKFFDTPSVTSDIFYPAFTNMQIRTMNVDLDDDNDIRYKFVVSPSASDEIPFNVWKIETEGAELAHNVPYYEEFSKSGGKTDDFSAVKGAGVYKDKCSSIYFKQTIPNFKGIIAPVQDFPTDGFKTSSSPYTANGNPSSDYRSFVESPAYPNGDGDSTYGTSLGFSAYKGNTLSEQCDIYFWRNDLHGPAGTDVSYEFRSTNGDKDSVKFSIFDDKGSLVTESHRLNDTTPRRTFSRFNATYVAKSGYNYDGLGVSGVYFDSNGSQVAKQDDIIVGNTYNNLFMSSYVSFEGKSIGGILGDTYRHTVCGYYYAKVKQFMWKSDKQNSIADRGGGVRFLVNSGIEPEFGIVDSSINRVVVPSVEFNEKDYGGYNGRFATSFVLSDDGETVQFECDNSGYDEKKDTMYTYITYILKDLDGNYRHFTITLPTIYGINIDYLLNQVDFYYITNNIKDENAHYEMSNEFKLDTKGTVQAIIIRNAVIVTKFKNHDETGKFKYIMQTCYRFPNPNDTSNYAVSHSYHIASGFGNTGEKYTTLSPESKELTLQDSIGIFGNFTEYTCIGGNNFNESVQDKFYFEDLSEDARKLYVTYYSVSGLYAAGRINIDNNTCKMIDSTNVSDFISVDTTSRSANDLFFSIKQAYISNNELVVSVRLCSNAERNIWYAVTQYRYNSDTGETEVIKDGVYCPGSIYGDADIEDAVNMKYYTMKQRYDGTSSDSDYGLEIQFVFNAKQFKYISDISSNIDISQLIPACTFTEQMSKQLQSAFEWTMHAPQVYFNGDSYVNEKQTLLCDNVYTTYDSDNNSSDHSNKVCELIYNLNSDDLYIGSSYFSDKYSVADILDNVFFDKNSKTLRSNILVYAENFISVDRRYTYPCFGKSRYTTCIHDADNISVRDDFDTLLTELVEQILDSMVSKYSGDDDKLYDKLMAMYTNSTFFIDDFNKEWDKRKQTYSVLDFIKIQHDVGYENGTAKLVGIPYNFHGTRPLVIDNDCSLKNVDDNTFYVYNKDKSMLVKIDYSTKQCQVKRLLGNNPEKWYNADETFSDRNGVELYSDDIRTLVAYIKGIYNNKGFDVESSNTSQVVINVDGNKKTINIRETQDGLFSDDKASYIDYLVTSVDDPAMKTESIARVYTDNEKQFVKQQWDTSSETECFWWIDSETILVLTRDKLLIKQKDGGLDDWDGDTWVVIKELSRGDYIPSSVRQYFCSFAHETCARFITLEVDNSSKLVFKVYNVASFVKSDGLIMEPSATYKFNIEKSELGNALVNTSRLMDNASGAYNLFTYKNINIDNFAQSVKLSATFVNNGGVDNFVLGMHYDNNLCQWAFIDDNRNARVVVGYGYVGVGGELTGGQIPYDYFDFNSYGVRTTGNVFTVNPLSSLANVEADKYDTVSISPLGTGNELGVRNKIIVGTESQQWYISDKIDSIVSHITPFDTTVVHKLPITNNYSYVYKSGSFANTTISDLTLKDTSLIDAFGITMNSTLKKVISKLTNTQLYYIAPRITLVNYLQQTLGQAAYVHYNNADTIQARDFSKENKYNAYDDFDIDKVAENMHPEAVGTDEVTFDRQAVKQEAKCPNPYDSRFGLIVYAASALVSMLDITKRPLEVNDSIKNFGEHFKKNIGNYVAHNLISANIADMTLNSVNALQNSEVTSIKSLDMFYSTSDKQNVYAGPGYVNHNFIAQCVSQSVTSLQLEAMQQRIIYTLEAINRAINKAALYGLTTVTEGISQYLIATSSPLEVQTGGGPAGAFFGTTAPSYALSIAEQVAWIVAKTAEMYVRISDEVVSTLARSISGGKINSTISAINSKHVFDVEMKHNYGSKSETFMWPCFDVTSNTYNSETVESSFVKKSWDINLDMGDISKNGKLGNVDIDSVTDPYKNKNDDFSDEIPYFVAMVKGKHNIVDLPNKMAAVVGVDSFLPETEYCNREMAAIEPVFTKAVTQDYIIDNDCGWDLSRTASAGCTFWISSGDTKLLDGDASNIVVSTSFCGVASTYAAIEVKAGVSKKYLRPWAITPQALALNISGLNCCYDRKAYHAFDGYGYRIINWVGSPGMNKDKRTWLYNFVTNDRFKRSNKLPNNEFLGNFVSEPMTAISAEGDDGLFLQLQQPGEKIGLLAGTVGEDKDTHRYSIPVFTEFVSTLPAAVKTISTIQLSAIDGITTLTTGNRDLNYAYKSPVSVDFVIGKSTYRYTKEYICSLQQENGATVMQELVPCLGLEFIGSTPYEAYLYSAATRQYHKYTGGTSLSAVDTIERFRNVISGRYDFLNQEVVVPCVATFERLDVNVRDDDSEVDNVIVLRLKDNAFTGEVWPPIETIFNDKFRTISLSSGITYQGPNRCIINRFIVQPYMIKQIRDNYGKWKRVHKEDYHPFRKYKAEFIDVEHSIGDKVLVEGWTHNPFLLVTAPLGINDDTDCMFEWEITFAWPVEMDKLYGESNYAVVMVQAETMTPGGKVVAERPTHIYLTKELFTRTGNYGYYSFRYQSKCGIGNRERLHIWSDQYIAISSLQCEVKQMTARRNEILTQQVDVRQLVEV